MDHTMTVKKTHRNITNSSMSLEKEEPLLYNLHCHSHRPFNKMAKAIVASFSTVALKKYEAKAWYDLTREQNSINFGRTFSFHLIFLLMIYPSPYFQMLPNYDCTMLWLLSFLICRRYICVVISLNHCPSLQARYVAHPGKNKFGPC